MRFVISDDSRVTTEPEHEGENRSRQQPRTGHLAAGGVVYWAWLSATRRLALLLPLERALLRRAVLLKPDARLPTLRMLVRFDSPIKRAQAL